MNLWSVEYFLNIFVITFWWVQQQSNSKPTQKWWQNEKKWATGQSCIRKEVTSYKIHTLGDCKIRAHFGNIQIYFKIS